MIKSIKPALSVVALSLAMLSQGAVAAEEQFFPIPGYRVGPYGANGQSFYGGFIDYLTYVNLKEKGVKVTREAGPMKHGTTVIAFVEDPDGYKIELIQK